MYHTIREATHDENIFDDSYYTGGQNVWVDSPFYLVKQPQEKWACDFHDDALPLSFQLQVAEVIS